MSTPTTQVTQYKKQKLDQWLDEVNYDFLNSSQYVPSSFALQFMNFIKLVNGQEGESHETPPMHLAMLDKISDGSQYIVNLCFRGAAKTTLFMEYLVLYLAVFGELPKLGKVESMIYVSDSMENGVKTARKNIEFRYNNSEFLKEWVPKAQFTDNYLEFHHKEGRLLAVKMFGAKTGLRGTKSFGKRPVLAVLDDLVSDEDARSKASMDLIKDTVYQGVNHALDPTRRLVIFNGTPFHEDDIMVEAVESGGWNVNVWPVCDKFPCTEEEFQGAWPDRFTYKFVKSQYDLAMSTGKLPSFLQELLLRITTTENRLVQDGEIRWYSRQDLIRNKHKFNFYITTDIATTDKQSADYTVLSVWAYNSNGDWFWVDGVMHKKTINHTWDELFRLVQEYRPQQVGIEISGQQNSYINTLQTEMMNRNIWFNFASNSKSGEPGIRPVSNKLSRFNLVVPWFKSGKILFPKELQNTPIMLEMIHEISLATMEGLKSKHDDCIDTVSMLSFLKPWKPSDTVVSVTDSDNVRRMWDDEQELSISPKSVYLC